MRTVYDSSSPGVIQPVGHPGSSNSKVTADRGPDGSIRPVRPASATMMRRRRSVWPSGTLPIHCPPRWTRSSPIAVQPPAPVRWPSSAHPNRQDPGFPPQRFEIRHYQGHRLVLERIACRGGELPHHVTQRVERADPDVQLVAAQPRRHLLPAGVAVVQDGHVHGLHIGAGNARLLYRREYPGGRLVAPVECLDRGGLEGVEGEMDDALIRSGAAEPSPMTPMKGRSLTATRPTRWRPRTPLRLGPPAVRAGPGRSAPPRHGRRW